MQIVALSNAFLLGWSIASKILQKSVSHIYPNAEG